jgi:hypothetical protein
VLTDRPAVRLLDVPTIIAIAIVAYILADVLHEGVGHGGVCILTGGKPLVLSTVHFDCGGESRWVAAGGTLVNLAAGAVSLGLLQLTRDASAHVRYFLWLFMTVNLLQGGGYFLFSGFANVGDWAAVVAGLRPAWAWRVGLALLGFSTYLGFVWIALLQMGQIVGGGEPERSRRVTQLAVIPYLTGGIVSCVAGLLNPVGMILVGISAAAASFGGTSGLVWMMRAFPSERIPKPLAPPLTIHRHWGWIAAGGALLAVFVLVLGPSVRLS